mmetsp:Transcript_3700/g.4523  ORF Transcript_3700/g.4523 Transcript_3700/m.4523 type:complete len:168 (-) Transcript_3700:62-565(-)
MRVLAYEKRLTEYICKLKDRNIKVYAYYGSNDPLNIVGKAHYNSGESPETDSDNSADDLNPAGPEESKHKRTNSKDEQQVLIEEETKKDHNSGVELNTQAHIQQDPHGENNKENEEAKAEGQRTNSRKHDAIEFLESFNVKTRIVEKCENLILFDYPKRVAEFLIED